MYTRLLLVAAVIQACSGAVRPKDPRSDARHRSDVMSREIEQRLHGDLKRGVTTHHNKEMFGIQPSATLSEDPPTASPSSEPTAEPSYVPTPPQDPPTAEPTWEAAAPTAIPTRAPTAPSPEPSIVPSFEPSSNSTAPSCTPTMWIPTGGQPTGGQPTGSQPVSSLPAGYLYMTNSFTSDCSNPAVSFGFPVETCIVASSFSYVVHIEDDNSNTASIDYYSDPECRIPTAIDVPITNDEVKCQETDSYLVMDPNNQGGKVYSQLFITTSSTPPRNGPVGGALFEYFEGDTNCAAFSNSTFLSYTSHVCLSGGEGQGAFSVECSADATSVRMNIDTDEVPNCFGTILQLTFQDTCEQAGDDDDDYYTTEYKLNPPPSTSTTPFPPSPAVDGSQRVTCQATQVPTAPPKAFTFKVIKQVINGFSKGAYDSDVAVYSLTLKQAIAATMQDVDVDGITDMVVTASAARASADTARATLRALQASSAVDLAYTVSGVSHYSSSQLASQLQAALASGDFNTVLHLYAAQNGATELASATSSSAETDIKEDKAAPLLSTGAIIGIAVGGGALLLFVVALIVWLMCRKSTGTVSYDAAPTSNTVTTA